MYRHLQYIEHQDGAKSDSVKYFIHYKIIGDTTIANIRYRILVEEDLALFNTDLGLLINKSAYAVRYDSSGLEVKALKNGRQATGRFPFKRSTGAFHLAEAVSFDSLHFVDEIDELRMPFMPGLTWYLRAPENPYGLWPATKVYLGLDRIVLSGKAISAFKFQIQVKNLEYMRTYEWYAGNVKVLSRTSSSIMFDGRDSLRSEEEYIGPRTFTREDTTAVVEKYQGFVGIQRYFKAPA